MRIYITGSTPGPEKAKEDKADDSRLTDEQRREKTKRMAAQEHFRRCCADLGLHLAKQGHSFVFGSIAEHTADRAVLEGVKQYAVVTPGVRVSVTLVQRDYDSANSPDGQTSISAVLPPTSFDVEMRQVQAGNNHARLIAGFPYADVGLLICGGSGTMTAGVAALALKHPTLPLPHFGGASAQAWQLVLPRLSRSTLTPAQMAELTGDWSDRTPTMIEQVLQQMRRSNPFVDRIELDQLLLSAAAFLLVVAWIVLFAAAVTSQLIAFFLLSGIAAALGSTFRSIVSCHFNVETRFALGRFLTELVLGIVVAFLLFLLLQLGNVVVSGTTMTLSFADAEQFRRLAVTMSLVAFAGAYLVERALEHLRGRLMGLLDGASATSRDQR